MAPSLIVAPDAPILLFSAMQKIVPPGTEPTRHYTLHCPGHDDLEITTELELHRDGPGDDATVLGNLIGHLRRAALTQGVVCRHTPKGWRR